MSSRPALAGISDDPASLLPADPPRSKTDSVRLRGLRSRGRNHVIGMAVSVNAMLRITDRHNIRACNPI